MATLANVYRKLYDRAIKMAYKTARTQCRTVYVYTRGKCACVCATLPRGKNPVYRAKPT